MKKQKNKQAKKASKLAKAENLKQKIITVKNAEGDPDTTAKIIVHNKIDYTPKVSVIIPVYNVEKYLPQCLDSVVKQTLKEIEIICVDDGSTDNSLSILKEYAAKDNRITVIAQKNLHAGVARNAGLAIARGEYVHFLDSDDWVEKEIYKSALKDINRTKVNVYLFNYNEYDMYNDQYTQKIPYNKCNQVFDFNDYQIFLMEKPVVPWNKIYNRDFIEKNKLRFDNTIIANDRTFYFKMLFSNPIIMRSTNDIGMLNYRINNSKSLVGTKRLDNFNCHFKVFENCIDICEKKYPNFIAKIIDLFIKDCFYFYNKASDNKKIQIKKIMRNYFIEKAEYFSNYKNELKKLNWYSEYQSIVNSNIIPIVFATNEKYAKFINVVIKSILDNSSTKYFYQFYVFYSNISKDAINSFNCIEKDNCNISFINMKEKVGDLSFLYSRGRFSQEMWYRIFIPEILKEYDKALYLDCDIIVCKDISKLWEVDIKNNYLGACRNYVSNSHDRLMRLGIDPDKYFNSGVLVFNNNSWNKNNLKEKCLEVLKKHQNLDCPDQDVLNIVCQNNIRYIDTNWNFMWQYIILDEVNKLSESDKLSYLSAEKNINLIHYTTSIKPWNNPQYKYANYWWKYALQTKLFNCNYRRNLEAWYKQVMKQELNLDNPKTFNEKIQWLKLYDSTPIKTRLADKYLVRDWVKEKIGEQYLVPLLGVYDKFEDIDFTKLPDRFVIKCNHGSGWNIIVKDKSKLDLAEVKQKLDKWMHENFAFKSGYELHYRDIKPKIIIEKYMTNDNNNLYDYKFWCFNGSVKYMQFRDDFSSNLKMAFYDLSWNKQSFYYDHPLYGENLEKPSNFDEMVKIAESLCKGFSFVCVDLYCLNDGSIYFGEMTFTRSSGTGKWNDETINNYFGNLIKLPKLAYDIDSGKYYKLPKKSMVLPWLMLPFNYLRIKCLQHKLNNLQVKQVYKQLSSFRIDVKNLGTADNSLEVVAPKATVNMPVWLTNSQGKGCVVSGTELSQSLNLKAVKDGKLQIFFRGPDKRFNNVRYPLWIDYKSIKINGKEILSTPVATWHDKPFKYEMPVKNGQNITVEIKQQPHQYSVSELKDVILKLNPNNNYIKSDIAKIVAEAAKTYKQPHKPKAVAEVKPSAEEQARQQMLALLQQSLNAVQAANKEISSLKATVNLLQKELAAIKIEQVNTQKMLVDEQTLLQKRRKLK